ncbi:MAG: hypothetical protein L6305_03940, partial [Actinomycetia bacterium]|nr:hypothetical protein [bacterium]MCG2790886.1 hypothetical protein [Actinomycetes bacterium]
LSKANLPRMRFLYSLVKHCYPRKDRRFVNVHSDKLKEWSIHNYLKYLDELIKLEIVKRGDAYQIDKFSKSINIKWNFRDSSNAILDDNRAPDTLENTIRLSYAPEEFKELLKGAGSERHTAIKTVERIYKG